MVDFALVHSITIELCTGFLLLGGTAVAVKVVSDFWLRHFRSRSARLDRWALGASRLAEPTSYFAIVAGVLATFVSMVTGSLAWPADQLAANPTVHNKILLTTLSQVVFIGAIIIRTRYGFQIWFARSTGLMYAFLVLTGVALLTLQNSVAGHLAGKGSILDEFLHGVGVDTHPMWTFPEGASLAIIVGFPLMAVIVGLFLRRQAKSSRPVAAPA